MQTRTCAYQGVRNISFSKNFTCVLNEWSYKSITENCPKSGSQLAKPGRPQVYLEPCETFKTEIFAKKFHHIWDTLRDLVLFIQF